MAWCLTVPSHYLNQCWIIISGVLQHAHQSNFIGCVQEFNPQHELENYSLKFLPHHPVVNELRAYWGVMLPICINVLIVACFMQSHLLYQCWLSTGTPGAHINRFNCNTKHTTAPHIPLPDEPKESKTVSWASKLSQNFFLNSIKFILKKLNFATWTSKCFYKSSPTYEEEIPWEHSINIMRLRQNGRHFDGNIFRFSYPLVRLFSVERSPVVVCP